ncbi:2-dehydro-3-deoxyphosphooctonate aldolase [Flavobacterium litorale]|uniref:2-dehydro-3-deoxyphosphooctonate aldolase n=1 Tax=Flavobacterium litorale TaxID=2856519 RepID=A0ABX8V7Y0_9FLAO|nr:2-dehydro-3-deoxyphosphooctonate aldolase [Flavobacterium litorale]QYJ67318.1 2-dehydro-3-deoxyphosphooctonate aldolase [Flavobacterium litorale]
MKIKLLTLFLTIVLVGCASKTSHNRASKVAADYGYSEDNPIKVGGVSNGPSNERKYLHSLTGLNGEPVYFKRLGSCCPFKSEKAALGGGMLDLYEVKIQGDTVTKKLYLNMYDKDKLYAPKGFLMKD